MKIGIDISPIIYGTGVSIYTKEIVSNLVKIDSQNNYLLFGGSLRRLSEFTEFTEGLGASVEKKFLPFPPTAADMLWNILRTPPLEVLIGKVDVFHSSDWTQPPTKAFKITTVHDLAPIRFPREMHPRIVAVHKRRLDIIKKEIDRVIVPSLATMEDLVNYGVGQEKIRVIPEAASIIHSPATAEEIAKVKNKYKIDSNYIVSIGVGQRKNTERLIEAFEKVRAGQDLKLVLIGRPTKKYEESRGVRFTGHVSDQEFKALVSGSQALVYVSLYEGFGLPILEGFNAAVPVVTSNLSSMVEVAGKAAELVDPYEIDSISSGIRSVLKSPKKYIESGNKRAREFSWLKAAEKTLEVYEEGRI